MLNKVDPTNHKSHLKYWKAIYDLKPQNGFRILKDEHDQNIYLDCFSTAVLIENLHGKIIGLYGALDSLIVQRLLRDYFFRWKCFFPSFEYIFYVPRNRAKLRTVFFQWKNYTENNILSRKLRYTGAIIINTILNHKCKQLLKNRFIHWIEFINKRKKLLIQTFHAWSSWTSNMILTKHNVIHIFHRAEYYYENLKKHKLKTALSQWSSYIYWKMTFEYLKLIFKRWKMFLNISKTRLRLFATYWIRWRRMYVSYQQRIEVSYYINLSFL